VKQLVGIFTLVYLSVSVFATEGSHLFVPEITTYDADTPKVNLPFPLSDYYDFTQKKNSPVSLGDPENLTTEIVYNPETGMYDIYQKIGSLYYRYPTSMTLSEYMDYQRRQTQEQGFRDLVKSTTEEEGGNNPIPSLKIQSKFFDDVFGGDRIDIRPQGSAQLSLGVNISRYDNPILPVKNRRMANFDFQQQINLNLVGQIGDKLKLTIAQNTEATFNFQNLVKIEYTGYEDEIIQKIQAGNVSLPLNTSLIQGSQSLFGIRTDLKFGRLTMNLLASQQKGKRQEIDVAGGAQVQDYEITADNYEANKHYFLNYYHREHYDTAMQTMPIVNSSVQITRIEVWVTNRVNKVEETRNIIAFTDLGETNPDNCQGNPIFFNGILPDNSANELYGFLAGMTQVRAFSNAVQALSTVTGVPGPFVQSSHYEKVENARKLSDQEFSYGAQLGYISLKSPLNQDEVLGVAYQYTYQGRTYQVGEFSTDVPIETGSKSALILKLLKPTVVNPQNKTWDLMMKNVYSIGAYQVSAADFVFDIWYNNPKTSVNVNYLPYGGVDGKLTMQQLELDRLNLNQQLQPDGRFDFVPIMIEGAKAINGGTIDPKTGRVYFTTIEPFGRTLRKKLESESTLAPNQIDAVVFQELYDSTKTAAQQIPGKNRFMLKGRYKSSVSSEISLNAMNIPQGSVTVLAGGVKLTEGADYSVDYNLGRVKILNQGILESGTPIKVQMENNSTFGLQQKSMVGAHFNYEFSKDFNIGATVMNLSEKPLTQKVTVGDEPVSNTMLGLDFKYRTEIPFITKMIDFLPIISTKEKSTLTTYGEFARLIPRTQRAISKEGISYIDGFEGSQTAIDIKTFGTWKLASVPQGQFELIPEGNIKTGLAACFGRAQLSWYVIDPSAFYPNASTGSIIPQHIKDDPLMQEDSRMRMVSQTQLFPQRQLPQGQLTNIPTFDMAYYPAERGQYNFDTSSINIDVDGYFTNPQNRWAGVMRSLTTTNFETSNVQFIQFWMLNPFNNDATDSGLVNMDGGDLYFNLGNIAEDILPDGRKSFENGLPTGPTFDANGYDTTDWAFVSNQQIIVNAFDNSTESRQYQDVGLDGFNNTNENLHFEDFVSWVNSSSLNSTVKEALLDDPSSDRYNYYLDDDYDVAEYDIIRRYKFYNGTDGNSPTSEMSATMNSQDYPTQATTTPDIEDLNQDNNLSETESYFQYKISLRPSDMVVGQNFIINETEFEINEDGKLEKWYQFKIPITSPEKIVNGIADFRSIRFMRMFMHGFEHPVVLRFATLELVRGEWRKYLLNLNEPGEYIPDDPNTTVFNLAAVNLEENEQKEPCGYIVPPGIVREQDNGSINLRQLNEQSLTMEVCGLRDGEARACYKNVTLDVRSYKKIKMFIHGETRAPVESALKDDQLSVFVRLGTDFVDNYYEYEIPLKLTPWGTQSTTGNADLIWPPANEMEIIFKELTDLKIKRDVIDFSPTQEYSDTNMIDETGVITRIKVKGNPNLQGMKVIMIGVRNPGKDTDHPWMDAEDGLDKCVEVWVNELRLTDFDQHGGWAATAGAQLQMADFANVNLAGNYSTPGWGSIEKKVSERQRDTRKSFDVNGNVELGQFFGRKLNLQVPFYAGYSAAAIDPKFDLLSPDVLLREYDAEKKQQRKELSRDLTIRKSYNFTNVRRERPSNKEMRFWNIENWTGSYSYNELFRRDLNTDHDVTKTYRLGLNYNFTGKPLLVEPFKNVKFLKKSKWLKLISETNFYLGPKSIGFVNDLQRLYNERQNRNALDTTFIFKPTYLKNFTWKRTYDFKYDFTKELKLTFNASNSSIVLEPEGIIDRKAAQGSLGHENYQDFITQVKSAFTPFDGDTIRLGGYTMNYNHDFNVIYKVPFNKIPITEFLSANVKLRGSYDWQRAPLSLPQYGHTIQNARNFTINGQANLLNLYNLIPWLSKVNNGGKTGRGGRPTADKETADGEKVDADPEDENKEGDEKDKKDKKDKRDEIHPALMAVGRLIMTARNVSITYAETDGMRLPGFANETSLLGMNNFQAPSLAFVTGQQNYDLFGRPTKAWGSAGSFAPYAANNGWLVPFSGLNLEHNVTHLQTINGRVQLEPFKDLSINLTIDRNFTKNQNSFYRYNDTLVTPDGTGYWEYQNKVDMGSLTFTNITWKTAFSKMDSAYVSGAFTKMRAYRQETSKQLGEEYGTTYNPETGYYEGFGNNQQDVLIGSFLTAYAGHGAGSKFFDVFKAIPLPNWDIRYDGLTKLKFLKKRVKNFSITHAYRSTVSVSNFQTNLAAFDQNGVQQMDASGNFIPGKQIFNVTIAEQFAPFLGLDATWNVRDNGLITKFEYKRDRTVGLNVTNLQVMEMRGTEWVIGSGYKLSKVKLPFKILGKTVESDLNMQFDLSIRSNVALARNIIENTTQPSSGQRMYSLKIRIDYDVSQNLNIALYFDRTVNKPELSNAYPTANTAAGVSLRFNLAQ